MLFGSGRNNLGEWFAALDRFADVPFMEDGREQPPMPDEHNVFDGESDEGEAGKRGQEPLGERRTSALE